MKILAPPVAPPDPPGPPGPPLGPGPPRKKILGGQDFLNILELQNLGGHEGGHAPPWGGTAPPGEVKFWGNSGGGGRKFVHPYWEAPPAKILKFPFIKFPFIKFSKNFEIL